MDIAAGMKDEDNNDDKLTLPWWRAWLGNLEMIYNKESKIKLTGNFEIHDQEQSHYIYSELTL